MGSSKEPGAEDGLGFAGEYGMEEKGELEGVVFQVGVLDHRDVARGPAEVPFEEPLPFPCCLVEHESVDEALFLQTLQQVPGAVRRAVVNDDDLQLQRHLPHPAKQRLGCVDLIVRRDHHGEDHMLPGQIRVGNTGVDHGMTQGIGHGSPSGFGTRGGSGHSAEPETVQLPVKGRGVDPQDLGGPALVPPLSLQHPLDVGSLDDLHRRVGKGPIGHESGSRRLQHPLRKVVDADFGSVHHGGSTLEGVLQLSDISRPVVDH